MKTYSLLALGLFSVLIVGACAPGKNINQVGGQFWQRVSVSDAAYQQGPKAQQMLNRDISRCVTELRELERVGAVKNAIPVDAQGRTLNPNQQELYDWDTPEREKYLYAEHLDYTDFEGCMMYKGWERIEHAPYDVARKGRENYLRAHVDKEYKPEAYARIAAKKKSAMNNGQGDYGDLNK